MGPSGQGSIEPCCSMYVEAPDKYAYEMCHMSEHPEVDSKGWLRCLFDSGCGCTAFPKEAGYSCSRPASGVCVNS